MVKANLQLNNVNDRYKSFRYCIDIRNNKKSFCVILVIIQIIIVDMKFNSIMNS